MNNKQVEEIVEQINMELGEWVSSPPFTVLSQYEKWGDSNNFNGAVLPIKLLELNIGDLIHDYNKEERITFSQLCFLAGKRVVKAIEKEVETRLCECDLKIKPSLLAKYVKVFIGDGAMFDSEGNVLLSVGTAGYLQE